VRSASDSARHSSGRSIRKEIDQPFEKRNKKLIENPIRLGKKQGKEEGGEKRKEGSGTIQPVWVLVPVQPIRSLRAKHKPGKRKKKGPDPM